MPQYPNVVHSLWVLVDPLQLGNSAIDDLGMVPDSDMSRMIILF